MKNTVETPYAKFEVETYFRHIFSGYGHWKIICSFDFNGESTSFTHTTTDSQTIDLLTDLSGEKAQQLYSDTFLSHFEERIVDWCESL